IRDSIPCLRGNDAGPAEAERIRRKIFPFLEDETIRLQTAVAVKMRASPQVDLEEAEHTLAIALDQLAPGRVEVARPCLEGEEVAVPVVVQGHRFQIGAVGRRIELRKDHGSVIAGEDVAIREGAHVELLPSRREVHVETPARLEERVDPLEEGGV